MPGKPSLLQQIIDGLVGPLGGSTLADVLTNRLLYDEDDEFHPKGERKGSVENLIKVIGRKYGTLISPDMPYLEQYLHPESDVLPKTAKPPKRPGTLPYREPVYSRWKDEKLHADIAGLGGYSPVDPTTGYPSEFFEHPYYGRMPLENEKDTYVFDKWDFDTPSSGMLKDTAGGNSKMGRATSEFIKLLMRNAGKPYAIYGPETKDK